MAKPRPIEPQREIASNLYRSFWEVRNDGWIHLSDNAHRLAEAELAGIANWVVRLQTLVLMGAISGLSGAMYVGFRGAVDPNLGSDFVLGRVERLRSAHPQITQVL